MPYVYKLYCKPIDKIYIGSRTKSGHKNFEEDFWKIYFTSSSIVRLLIEEYGLDSFEYEKLNDFESIEECIKFEHDMLSSIEKKDRINYLNMNFSAGGAVLKNQTHVKITNGITFIYFPKGIDIPDGWYVKWNHKPPSQKGRKKYIHLLSGKISSFYPDSVPTGYMHILEYKSEQKKQQLVRNIWITDGFKNTKISVADIIPDGWRLGKVYKKKPSGRPVNSGGKTSKDTFAINKDGVTKFIPNTDSIPDGWSKGDGAGKIWCTNGFQNKRVKCLEDIPQGWYRGSTKGTKGKNG